MSGSHSPVPANAERSFPLFEGEPHYVEGYHPSSLDAQHSSLIRSSTWIGMGLLLSSLAGFGVLLFGLGTWSVGTQQNWAMMAVVGAILAVVFLVGGFWMIHHGRRYYREYAARTGRH
ncbi:hypothetical protein M0E87_01890 [Corynebacterium sp. CCM 9185]|uniref:UsfY protein n=1 Tax=Corynebacterium marambiense TaxID=2765364 RepID=A0ABS0VTF1_9CORY|nr:hypothetical protein [Corynebacterium marambiense]MBI8999584.1 hypothetical protein [Corynebacterium marambiense]MCK7662422.1 hypothetical protein [Corynebacterium marambiense]MCX7541709.1 hypothetical protein [Corynebacterium marambiense]